MERRGVGSAVVTLFLNVGLAVSLNLAIVVISFTAPYDRITRVISAVNSVSISVADKLLFFESIKNTYFAIALVNAVAILPSILQWEWKPGGKKAESPPVTVSE